MVKARKKSAKKEKIADNIYGWLFSAPLLIGLSVFLFVPLGFAVYYSLTNISFTNLDTYTFIGFKNYATAFKDPIFLRSLVNALINCIGVPIGMIIALVLANFLSNTKHCSGLFRVIYYIPTICGAAAISYIWLWLYSHDGLINHIITGLGLESVEFDRGRIFLPSMIIMGVWNGFGVSVLLLFAALKNVSKQLYEAASIDGAGGFKKFFKISVPAVFPTLFFIIVTGVSGSFQDFARFRIMAASPISNHSVMPAYLVYDFTNNHEIGKGCAYGILLGLIIIFIFVIQNLVQKRLNKNA